MQLAIRDLYKILRDYYGKTYWWPADTPFEIAVGAVLTQNTNWKNVEKAVYNLKKSGMLECSSILKAEPTYLKDLIRPAGFFNQKYSTIIRLCSFINGQLCGRLENLKKYHIEDIKHKLLNIKGIGKETADSIILYTLQYPVFVIDAYTKRILHRLDISKETNYDKLQQLFHSSLANDPEIFGEYHGLLVEHAKNFCRKKPVCKDCFLGYICIYKAEEKVG